MTQLTPVRMSGRARLTIGDVTFMRRSAEDEIVEARLYGDERVRALRAFYRREELGDLVPWALPALGGQGAVKWEDVRWDTAGPRVTVEEESR